MGHWSGIHPGTIPHFFPGWSLSCILSPGCCIKPPRVWKEGVPTASLELQQPWGWGTTAGHPPEHCPGCWFSAPGGRLWNCSSSRHLCVFPCWKTVCESFLCGEGRISPLWTDLLTFSSEPAESHELKGGSPVEACGENLIRAYLALTHQAEHGQAEQNIQSYI